MTDTTNANLPTIIYVEDNAGDAMLLEEALRDRGHATQLQVIETGDRAQHYFEVKAQARDLPPPHCILLDKYLPVVTGSQLLRFIRSSPAFNDTPVYFFGPHEEYADLLRDGSLTRDNFLTKPTSWNGFLKLADLLMRSASGKQQDAKEQNDPPVDPKNSVG
jgi:CheY-like chemotaxis protein